MAWLELGKIPVSLSVHKKDQWQKAAGIGQFLSRPSKAVCPMGSIMARGFSSLILSVVMPGRGGAEVDSSWNQAKFLSHEVLAGTKKQEVVSFKSIS